MTYNPYRGFTSADYKILFACAAEIKETTISKIADRISRISKISVNTVDQLAYNKSKEVSEEKTAKIFKALRVVFGGSFPVKKTIEEKAEAYLKHDREMKERAPYKEAKELADALIKSGKISSIRDLALKISEATGYRNFAESYGKHRPIPRVAVQYMRLLMGMKQQDPSSNAQPGDVVAEKLYQLLAPRLVGLAAEIVGRKDLIRKDEFEKALKQIRGIIADYQALERRVDELHNNDSDVKRISGEVEELGSSISRLQNTAGADHKHADVEKEIGSLLARIAHLSSEDKNPIVKLGIQMRSLERRLASLEATSTSVTHKLEGYKFRHDGVLHTFSKNQFYPLEGNSIGRVRPAIDEPRLYASMFTQWAEEERKKFEKRNRSKAGPAAQQPQSPAAPKPAAAAEDQ